MSYFDEPGIKRGVSLYSYQQAYFLRELTLEQCIAEAAKIGAVGIESFAEQMMPGFPDIPDSFYEETWPAWMETYAVERENKAAAAAVRRLSFAGTES